MDNTREINLILTQSTKMILSSIGYHDIIIDMLYIHECIFNIHNILVIYNI